MYMFFFENHIIFHFPNYDIFVNVTSNKYSLHKVCYIILKCAYSKLTNVPQVNVSTGNSTIPACRVGSIIMATWPKVSVGGPVSIGMPIKPISTPRAILTTGAARIDPGRIISKRDSERAWRKINAGQGNCVLFIQYVLR